MKLIPILLAAALLLPAQMLSDWKNVEQLTPGATVQVVSANRKTVQGSLRQVDEQGLVVDDISIPRAAVVRVSRSKGRLRNALIGAAIGAGAGAAVGAVVRARFDNEGQNGDVAVAGALGAGAAIGAAIGASRIHFETIYRVEKLPGRN